MSTTVQQIYDQACFILLEPNGLQLGLLTEAQFLHILGEVLLDFSQRAPLDKTIFTTPINAGVSEYLVPDDLMQPELCFVGGKLIEKVTEADLGQGHMDWRREIGTPRQWHEDNLPLKHLEIFPKSNFDGAAIVGDVPPIGKYGGFFPTERNLTMVGPAAPSKKSWALADTLDGIPDSFSHYLLFGILEQVFGGESELRDVQRAAYCHARFEEGVQVSIMLASEELLEKDN